MSEKVSMNENKQDEELLENNLYIVEIEDIRNPANKRYVIIDDAKTPHDALKKIIDSYEKDTVMDYKYSIHFGRVEK